MTPADPPMRPSREQVLEWAKEADVALGSEIGIEFGRRLCALAYAAGHKDGMAEGMLMLNTRDPVS